MASASISGRLCVGMTTETSGIRAILLQNSPHPGRRQRSGKDGDYSRQDEGCRRRQHGTQMARRIATHLDVVTQLVEKAPALLPQDALYHARVSTAIAYQNFIHLMNGVTQ